MKRVHAILVVGGVTATVWFTAGMVLMHGFLFWWADWLVFLIDTYPCRFIVPCTRSFDSMVTLSNYLIDVLATVSAAIAAILSWVVVRRWQRRSNPALNTDAVRPQRAG
jgi:hypothetical protein